MNPTERQPFVSWDYKEVAVESAYLSQYLDAYACFGWQVDRAALIRGALLHDYFLYDWHEKDDSHRLHGFTHPRTALRNACADWTLTDREQNIILRHMFPLTPVPPACREGWLVCLADKLCAVQEMVTTRTARLRPRRAAA